MNIESQLQHAFPPIDEATKERILAKVKGSIMLINVYTIEDKYWKAVEISKALGEFLGHKRISIEIVNEGRVTYNKIMVDTSGNFITDKQWMEGFCYGIDWALMNG